MTWQGCDDRCPLGAAPCRGRLPTGRRWCDRVADGEPGIVELLRDRSEAAPVFRGVAAAVVRVQAGEGQAPTQPRRKGGCCGDDPAEMFRKAREKEERVEPIPVTSDPVMNYWRGGN